MDLSTKLANTTVEVSVPCRLDLGGTLDISTFYLPLSHLKPATFNLALDMRTAVTLSAHTPGKVKISSRGFETAEFDRGRAPFDHPMGLMFACAQYFNAHGVYIHIESASPPRSALGGSSSAAVAILAAFYALLEKEVTPEEISWQAHFIESSVAGVPCGVQDQAAAAFGGVHLWEWRMGRSGPEFDRTPLFESPSDLACLDDHMRTAYCGIPHISKDVNKQWVDSFAGGRARPIFEEIVGITRAFADAVREKRWDLAGDLMAKETLLRLDMTPEVLDPVGKKLFDAARKMACGARFTGAGGGGCVWAIGKKENITALDKGWKEILAPVPDGAVLDTKVDARGILVK